MITAMGNEGTAPNPPLPPREQSPRQAQIFDRLMRILLRMIPLVPGPELYDLVRDLQKSRTEVGEKVDKAAASLREASKLVSELDTELTERMADVQRLRAEYEKYSHLAQIEEEQARALISQLSMTLNKGKTSERLIAFGISLVAGLIIFVLGLVLSPWVTAFFKPG
jgi:hypothetical protein